MKNLGILASSVNPQELSATFTGLMNSLAAMLTLFGFTAVSALLPQFAILVGQLITVGWVFGGLCYTLFGLIRKIVIAVQQSWQAFKS